MPNRLARSSSPYLLQHATNPVDWYEWGDEALQRARREDRPILLSVGYATCHWCHVMAHESFEDEATAEYMNAHFVNIKVDREERPDIDRVYMDAVQAMNGHGGWPMTVFLTPDGSPFFAGTYFPKEPRGHHPSFRHVMESVVDAWHNRRSTLDEQAARLHAAVGAGFPAGVDLPDQAAIDRALDDVLGRADWEHGGFGGAPKFPQAPNLELVLRALALDISPARRERLLTLLTTTLDRMAAGGIYDHLGGGFSRYSVDRHWLVPHFEKMLYDNALLARLYLRAGQVTGDAAYVTTARETLDYMLRDLADPAGGFYSGEDADSEGEEGKFYAWSKDELARLLGDDFPVVADVFGISDAGNFEGKNVLHRPVPLDVVASRFGLTPTAVDGVVERTRQTLRRARETRVRPSVDDKIVTAWNGLALRALAEAAAVLGDDRYLAAARRLAGFATSELFTAQGRLVRTWRRGVQGPPGFCDDYAALGIGLLVLYQVTGELEWWHVGRQLIADVLDLFPAPDGGFYASGADASDLITRPKNLMDNPTPSDNALMAEALQMLGALTGEAHLAEHLDGVYRSASRLIAQYPAATGHLLAVACSGLAGVKEIAIVGEQPARRPLEAVIWEKFRPECVLAVADNPSEEVPLLAGRSAGADPARAFVCRQFECKLPVSTPGEVRRLLDTEERGTIAESSGVLPDAP